MDLANLTFAGVFSVLFTLQNTFFPQVGFSLTSPALWIMLCAAMLGGALVAYPFWWWMAQRGHAVWIGWLAPASGRALSLREGWLAALVSLVVAVGTVVAMVVWIIG